eukprot:235170-Chlamydomonas_euryale.AAC.4
MAPPRQRTALPAARLRRAAAAAALPSPRAAWTRARRGARRQPHAAEEAAAGGTALPVPRRRRMTAACRSAHKGVGCTQGGGVGRAVVVMRGAVGKAVRVEDRRV